MTPSIRGPQFLGQSSPSLKKMRRMSRSALAEHLQRLDVEADRLDRRIQALRQPPGSGAELRQRIELRERLLALIDAGRRLYRAKQ